MYGKLWELKHSLERKMFGVVLKKQVWFEMKIKN